MSWSFARIVYVPFMPAMLFLLSPNLFADQTKVDADAPVIAQKPVTFVVAQKPVVPSASDALAQADAAKEEKKDDAKKDDSKK